MKEPDNKHAVIIDKEEEDGDFSDNFSNKHRFYKQSKKIWIFTHVEKIKGARQARLIQAKIGWPSTSDYKHIISSKSIKTSPITINDIDRTLHIFGSPVPLLQEKMTRPSPKAPNITNLSLHYQHKLRSITSILAFL